MDAEVATTVRPEKKSLFRSDAAQKLGAFAALIILFIFFSVSSPNFLTVDNIVGILLATAVNGVLALGVTFVIITGGIDLSIGTVMTFSAVMTGGVHHQLEAALADWHPGRHPGRRDWPAWSMAPSSPA